MASGLQAYGAPREYDHPKFETQRETRNMRAQKRKRGRRSMGRGRRRM